MKCLGHKFLEEKETSIKWEKYLKSEEDNRIKKSTKAEEIIKEAGKNGKAS